MHTLMEKLVLRNKVSASAAGQSVLAMCLMRNTFPLHTDLTTALLQIMIKMVLLHTAIDAEAGEFRKL